MNEEERDLEAELKEEKDRFEAQNQEAYDKEVSGENEIKEEIIKIFKTWMITSERLIF